MDNREHAAGENGCEKVGYREILRQKEYRKIILAGLINRFGDSIDAIAFTWRVSARSSMPGRARRHLPRPLPSAHSQLFVLSHRFFCSAVQFVL